MEKIEINLNGNKREINKNDIIEIFLTKEIEVNINKNTNLRSR